MTFGCRRSVRILAKRCKTLTHPLALPICDINFVCSRSTQAVMKGWGPKHMTCSRQIVIEWQWWNRLSQRNNALELQAIFSWWCGRWASSKLPKPSWKPTQTCPNTVGWRSRTRSTHDLSFLKRGLLARFLKVSQLLRGAFSSFFLSTSAQVAT